MYECMVKIVSRLFLFTANIVSRGLLIGGQPAILLSCLFLTMQITTLHYLGPLFQLRLLSMPWLLKYSFRFTSHFTQFFIYFVCELLPIVQNRWSSQFCKHIQYIVANFLSWSWYTVMNLKAPYGVIACQ